MLWSMGFRAHAKASVVVAMGSVVVAHDLKGTGSKDVHRLCHYMACGIFLIRDQNCVS